MGREGNPFLGDLPQPRQGEHLKPAGIGEYGPIPPYKLVQPPHLTHHAVSWAQVEVIGVGQLNLTAQFLQVKGGHRPLDSPLGAHIHKYRGLHRAVRAGKLPPPGRALGFDYSKHSILLTASDTTTSAPLASQGGAAGFFTPASAQYWAWLPIAPSLHLFVSSSLLILPGPAPPRQARRPDSPASSHFGNKISFLAKSSGKFHLFMV